MSNHTAKELLLELVHLLKPGAGSTSSDDHVATPTTRSDPSAPSSLVGHSISTPPRSDPILASPLPMSSALTASLDEVDCPGV